ncbi:hypothetical protein DEU56DRAFT_735345 [Suillus clintonianus]|uniref:uncharacterized protein n=1 Tax=Suillus clintonianus TaxID=1904413 RepID=UPI001B87F1D7|nr:uncharacterized protein DEU56DRAFT_747009 [Suillus clintonianus]XP_041205646.1 uncharacterized protein DEU56DRAFT_741940 [Suillus clintonianus]XP_041209470.1 uncharacterized protein DEU56DRAFT_735345 [Suillus clintonianus]KAG2120274.1 hypothetical protein DEU56DRAFT_747009 [Suillus clintonianus]KAG2128613.1 hypothetical protein DEU56DRAFT_741940 [Suillus clintonianus]KAG2140200.1 hypothetical protein DEU56DRAFT_735345 [Suillus clintonianus]
MVLPQQESDSDREDDTTAARAKRRIAALEQELENIRASKRSKPHSNSNVHKGRGIRRLVSLFDSLEDLVAENDRREDLLQSLDSQDELDRTFSSFNELLRCLPWLKKKLFSDVEELDSILKELRKGADSARGDDTANLKHAVVVWLNELFHPLDPPLRTTIKDDRGFVHNTTGMLLCPVEYVWSLSSTKDKIRDRDSDFLVTAYSWPAFIYKDYSFDSANIEKGLFRSTLLLKAFKHLFTSPSSAKEIDGDGNGADVISASQRRRSSENDAVNRSHLRFALSNINSWRSVDGDFDYYDFYNNIVDFFEVVPGADAQARINELLKWWNRKVFGKIRTVPLTSAQLGKFSVARMSSQREAHEGDSP